MFKSSKSYLRKVLFTGNLVIALLLCYMVAKTTLLPERLGKNLAPASVAGDDRMPANETPNPQKLSSANHTESEKTLLENSTDSERSASDDLGLVLLGTISGNPSLSRALIKNIRTDERGLYGIGQIVVGARIETIEKDRVILMYNGEKKVLELDTTQSDPFDSNTHTPSSQTTNEIQSNAGTDPPAPAALTRMNRINAILHKAVIEPYVIDGQIRGLQLNGLEDTGIAKDSGLKNGDVICAINGQQLTSKQKALQVLRKVRSQPSASVELLRDNETKKLSFPTQ